MTALQPEFLEPMNVAGTGATEGSDPVPATSTPVVIGVDLSLVSTGVAGGTWATTIPGGSVPDDVPHGDERRWTRICRVRARLIDYLDSADLVVLEAPAFGSNDPGAHERAALWWRVAGRCFSRGVPLATVAPSQVKVYATGNGRASKEDVVQEVQRRWAGVEFRGNDQADALVLAAMGLDHLGHPPVDLPQTHRRVIAKVRWPEVTR